ncbi:hypothetical protein VOLCADRAFT_106116 [Volvox carteri f. nagariensis]|uniref:Protein DETOXIFICATION n=1 Tax=Volvox carteri f. nagariensis TaxID=3068 RepID=D8U572_VOLCA|nr:uncharacterized protein VOLCADRAFT_106116 [Volvox carteri f. nagariensis]EFJ45163.1 hypothetical protein VOLCADRAFT_106116 [Volvox carteri f. nagariensis]|eukprot:XP_002953839.1 hypothetical protein VOLCADRAFT_106116 [Volvox carteri f. nagariensis]
MYVLGVLLHTHFSGDMLTRHTERHSTSLQRATSKHPNPTASRPQRHPIALHSSHRCLVFLADEHDHRAHRALPRSPLRPSRRYASSQVFLGHLGTAELGAAALANAYTNLMWFFLLGFATALDTLGSHAYGAGDRRALVTWCVTAAVLLTLLVAPLAVGMAMGEFVGRGLFDQDKHTAQLMGRFCNGLIPGMWPLMWGTVLTKYLQVQNVMLQPSLIAVITFALNIAFNAALVHTIGFRGAPLATSLSRWAQFLMLALAVWRHERRQRQQHKRRQSSDGERQGALEAAPALDEGAVLQPLPPMAAPLDAAGNSNNGAAGDRSNRGTLSANSHSTEQLRLLGEDRNSDEEDQDSSASGTGSRANGEMNHGPRCGANGYALASGSGRVSDPGSSSGVHRGSAMVMDNLESGVRVYQECRMAMHPRVVGRFCRLGIPGGLSMSFEAGCFDFSTVLAGRLGTVATAAHAAMLSIVTLTYLACPFALATAGAIRVGNLLGAGEQPGRGVVVREAGTWLLFLLLLHRVPEYIEEGPSMAPEVSGDPDGARRAGILAVTLSGAFMALMAMTLLATRSVLGYMFSADHRVVTVIRGLAVFAALFQVSDGLMGSSQGVLRGCGHQHLTAVFNFTGFWVCGVLLGFLLCFKAGLGLNGLWAGISAGDTATGIMNLIAMSRIRWRKESDRAVARLKVLAQQAEEEQAMLDGSQVAGLSAADSAAAPLGGGGRSYAGGLKRMWSERRLQQAVRGMQRRHQMQLAAEDLPSDDGRRGTTSQGAGPVLDIDRETANESPCGTRPPRQGGTVCHYRDGPTVGWMPLQDTSSKDTSRQAPVMAGKDSRPMEPQPPQFSAHAEGMLSAIMLKDVKQHVTCALCNNLIASSLVLSCGHQYCGSCLFDWLGNKPSCPNCQVPLRAIPMRCIALDGVVEAFLSSLPEEEVAAYKARQEEGKSAANKVNKMFWWLQPSALPGMAPSGPPGFGGAPGAGIPHMNGMAAPKQQSFTGPPMPQQLPSGGVMTAGMLGGAPQQQVFLQRPGPRSNSFSAGGALPSCTAQPALPPQMAASIAAAGFSAPTISLPGPNTDLEAAYLATAQKFGMEGLALPLVYQQQLQHQFQQQEQFRGLLHACSELQAVWRWHKEKHKLGLPMGPHLLGNRNPTEEDFRRTFPLCPVDWEALATPPTDGVQAVWVGHATVLVQMAGLTFITDPVFSERCAPVQFAGPKRVVPPALTCTEPQMPPLDFVLLSHNHYDHLDTDSVRTLHRTHGKALTWYVPLGLRSWFACEGMRDNVVEMDWWQSVVHTNATSGRSVTVTMVPSQHWSARVFKEIGERLGPIDLAAIPIGAYDPRWFMRPQHTNPEEGLQIAMDVRAAVSIGIHTATWSLTDEPLDEPPTRLEAAVRERGLPASSFVTLRHGGKAVVRSGRLQNLPGTLPHRKAC